MWLQDALQTTISCSSNIPDVSKTLQHWKSLTGQAFTISWVY